MQIIQIVFGLVEFITIKKINGNGDTMERNSLINRLVKCQGSNFIMKIFYSIQFISCIQIHIIWNGF